MKLWARLCLTQTCLLWRLWQAAQPTGSSRAPSGTTDVSDAAPFQTYDIPSPGCLVKMEDGEVLFSHIGGWLIDQEWECSADKALSKMHDCLRGVQEHVHRHVCDPMCTHTSHAVATLPCVTGWLALG